VNPDFFAGRHRRYPSFHLDDDFPRQFIQKITPQFLIPWSLVCNGEGCDAMRLRLLSVRSRAVKTHECCTDRRPDVSAYARFDQASHENPRCAPAPARAAPPAPMRVINRRRYRMVGERPRHTRLRRGAQTSDGSLRPCASQSPAQKMTEKDAGIEGGKIRPMAEQRPSPCYFRRFCSQCADLIRTPVAVIAADSDIETSSNGQPSIGQPQRPAPGIGIGKKSSVVVDRSPAAARP